MKLLLLIFFLVVVSCSLLPPVTHERFTFFKENRQHHISLHVPKGYQEEKIRLGQYGKEQYYTYSDGSRLFVGLNLGWPSINQERGMIPYADSIAIRSGSFKGIDRNKLHWKEIHFDYFMVGYSYVPADKVEIFDRAVHSLRFK